MFSKRWKDKKSEAQHGKPFLMKFLEAFGVDDAQENSGIEHPVVVRGGHDRHIDYLWKGKLAVEMKSRGENLNAEYDQLKDHMSRLPKEEAPDLWLVCGFERVWLWRRSTNDKWRFLTKDAQSRQKVP